MGIRSVTLASASPRRLAILNSVNLSVTVVPSNVDESQFRCHSPSRHVMRLAELKAVEVSQGITSGLVIGADTVVVVGGRLLEKPRHLEEAKEMLLALNGRWHAVLTGLCLIRTDTGVRKSGCEITRVKFAPMRPEEIDWYVATGEPMDKAGAYAIQGSGALFIDQIEGDYLNVVGLPLRLVYRLALELGVDLKGDLPEGIARRES